MCGSRFVYHTPRIPTPQSMGGEVLIYTPLPIKIHRAVSIYNMQLLGIPLHPPRRPLRFVV